MTYVYILQSIAAPGQLYIGVTSNLRQRLDYHNTGRSPHTSKFMPWKITHTERFQSEAHALKREKQIKGWTRAKKEALIGGDKDRLKKLSRRREI